LLVEFPREAISLIIMKNFLACSLFLFVLSSFGQDYIIKNNHDTIQGSIRVPHPAYHLHMHALFTDESGETVDYAPGDLVGFRSGLDSYETHDLGFAEPSLRFFKVVISGHCSLYEYSHQQLHHALPEPDYLLMKTDDHKYHRYDFKALKKGRDDYFSDLPMLNQDIQNGVYKKKDVAEIVERYNAEKE